MLYYAIEPFLKLTWFRNCIILFEREWKNFTRKWCQKLWTFVFELILHLECCAPNTTLSYKRHNLSVAWRWDRGKGKTEHIALKICECPANKKEFLEAITLKTFIKFHIFYMLVNYKLLNNFRNSLSSSI